MATKAKSKAADDEVKAPAPVVFIPPGCNGFLRKSQVCKLITVSMTTFKSMRARKAFPDPDAHMGKMPVWTIETLNQWIADRVASNRKG